MAESLHKNLNFGTVVDSLPYLGTAACRGNAVSVLQLDAGRSPAACIQLCTGMSCRHVLTCRLLFSVQFLFLLPETLVGLVEKNYEPPKQYS